LSADLDGLAKALRSADVPSEPAARLLELAAAAVVDAVALVALRDAAHGLPEAGGVDPLDRQVGPNPPQPVGGLFAQQAHRPRTRLAL
jgi:hypothetical protein